jgi:hypothetical protein
MRVQSRTERETHGAYFTIDQVKRANRDAGYHFFDADTLRFFGSRIGSTVYAGRFFVTTERSGFEHYSPRKATVREAMPDGSIETVGEFNEFDTTAQANAAIKRLRKERHAYYFDCGKTKRSRKTYVVTADDPWQAMEALPWNAVVNFMGRAQDYMTGPSYVHRSAK